MFVRLDPDVIEILCCAHCKSDLRRADTAFYCGICGLTFPRRKIKVGENEWEEVYDFRIQKPAYGVRSNHRSWEEIQARYEDFSYQSGERDSLQEYLDEIDSVKEIYTEEFHIAGRVLDVGGHQGRLRHFLQNDVSLYASIDPYIGVFKGVCERPNLMNAYPCLSEPCNFLAAHAEFLPFKSKAFDWIHMRSVVDHFEDPYLALLEAFRCCRPGGKILIGLAIIEKIEAEQSAQQNRSTRCRMPLWVRVRKKLSSEGICAVVHAAARRAMPRPKHPEKEIRNDHLFHFTWVQLMDLLQTTGWKIVKQHWQKPPHQFCLYASAEPVDTGSSTGALNL